MNRICATVAAMCISAAVPAFAQLAPESSPVPAERPSPEAGEEGGPGETAEAGAEDGAEASDAGPAAEPEDSAEAGEAPTEPPVPDPPVPEQLAENDLDLGMCLGRLEAFGTVYERGQPISEEGGACGIANPVRVTEIVPGVALAPAGIMRCDTAAALAAWVAHFALPASAMLPDRGRLVQVTQGSAYLCRHIGNAAEGALSEHAFGNAVDVMGFGFADGPAIPVEPREREGTPAEAYQRTVRAAACLAFTTVLGPGEPAHDDHLHLDIDARESGYRLCQ